jgi:hypothetical protein
MIFLSAIIIIYAATLFACIYALRRKLNSQNERAVSSEITSDAAKQTLQSMKNVDRKALESQSELGMLLLERLKAELKLTTSDLSRDENLDVDRAKLKGLWRD